MNGTFRRSLAVYRDSPSVPLKWVTPRQAFSNEALLFIRHRWIFDGSCLSRRIVPRSRSAVDYTLAVPLEQAEERGPVSVLDRFVSVPSTSYYANALQYPVLADHNEASTEAFAKAEKKPYAVPKHNFFDAPTEKAKLHQDRNTGGWFLRKTWRKRDWMPSQEKSQAKLYLFGDKKRSRLSLREALMYCIKKTRVAFSHQDWSEWLKWKERHFALLSKPRRRLEEIGWSSTHVNSNDALARRSRMASLHQADNISLFDRVARTLASYDGSAEETETLCEWNELQVLVDEGDEGAPLGDVRTADDTPREELQNDWTLREKRSKN